jgi:hypothetical protein
MELVIASIAFDHHFMGQGMFSTLALMGVVTTLLTPVLFRKLIDPHLARLPGGRALAVTEEINSERGVHALKK